MTTKSETAVGAAQSNDAGIEWAFSAMKKCVVIFGVVGVIVLVTLAVIRIAGGGVSTFMWVRAAILLAITPLCYRLAARAAQGVRKDFERLRSATLIVPIAIIVVDLIPGLCPAWYTAIQVVSALSLVAITVIARRQVVTRAFSNNA